MRESSNSSPIIHCMQTPHELISKSNKVVLLPIKITFQILELQISLIMWSIDILKLQGVDVKLKYIKLDYTNYCGHQFHDYMCFGSLNGTHYFNPMRYYGAFIENTCCHQPPSTGTQYIGKYGHFRILFIGQSLLLILA